MPSSSWRRGRGVFCAPEKEGAKPISENAAWRRASGFPISVAERRRCRGGDEGLNAEIESWLSCAVRTPEL